MLCCVVLSYVGLGILSFVGLVVLSYVGLGVLSYVGRGVLSCLVLSCVLKHELSAKIPKKIPPRCSKEDRKIPVKFSPSSIYT